MDANSWSKREAWFEKKFALGIEHVPSLFSGISLPEKMQQIALLGYGGRGGRSHLAQGEIQLISELLSESLQLLRGRSMHSAAVPEQYPILRTLHFVAQHKAEIRESLR